MAAGEEVVSENLDFFHWHEKLKALMDSETSQETEVDVQTSRMRCRSPGGRPSAARLDLIDP